MERTLYCAGTRGNSRLHLSYRGVPVLVTPEQTRHASRDEAELIAHEDLLRELSGLQRGFIDERGNAPGDPQNAWRRYERTRRRPDWHPSPMALALTRAKTLRMKKRCSSGNTICGAVVG